MRSTTGLDSIVLALLALGATVDFVDLLFPLSGVATGIDELANTFGMGVVMGVVFGSGVD